MDTVGSVPERRGRACPEGGTVTRAARRVATAAATALVAIGLGSAEATADPVIAAAGDIACDPADPGYNGGAGTSARCRQRATSDLLVGAGLAAVLPLGDIQYDSPTASRINAVYAPSWGRVKSISHPVLGNHDGAGECVLRLLQWGGRGGRPGRSARPRLLQLRHRGLAPRRAELQLHPSVVRRGLDPGALAPRRPRCASLSLHARLLAPPALQLRTRRQPRDAAATLEGAWTTPVRSFCSPATATTTSASHHVTGTARRARSASGSSWSVPGARS